MKIHHLATKKLKSNHARGETSFRILNVDGNRLKAVSLVDKEMLTGLDKSEARIKYKQGGILISNGSFLACVRLFDGEFIHDTFILCEEHAMDVFKVATEKELRITVEMKSNESNLVLFFELELTCLRGLRESICGENERISEEDILFLIEYLSGDVKKSCYSRTIFRCE